MQMIYLNIIQIADTNVLAVLAVLSPRNFINLVLLSTIHVTAQLYKNYD